MLYQRSLTQKIEEMYRMDSLTGLYNRIGFNQVYDELLHSENIWGFPITVIMSDLDGLKYINDNFGHGEGDNAIATVAKALKQACPHEALCVRFGGDEISAVIIGKCDPDSIISETNRILDAYNSTSGKEYTVRSSCGFHTSVFGENFDLKEALKIADEQMYSIKKRRHEGSI